MKLYKVLDQNGCAFHGGNGQWPLPNGKPGGWLRVEGELIPCRRGLHLCRRRDLIHWLGPTIWLAEARGDKVVAENKIVVRQARLLRKLDAWNDRTALLFAADCAERALKRAGREPDERSWAAVAATRAFVNGEIGRAAAYAAFKAASVAADYAAYNAYNAARTSAHAAAGAAAVSAERKWQTRRLHEYLNGIRA